MVKHSIVWQSTFFFSKHGRHSRSGLTTFTARPMGRHLLGSEGPKIVKVGRPRNPARCPIPESLPIKPPAVFKSALSFAIPTLVPFAFYQLFLKSLFGQFGFIGSGMHRPTMLPFYGIYQNIIKTSYPIRLPQLLNMTFLIIIPSLISWTIAIVKLLKREFTPAIIYLLLNAFYMTFLPTGSYVGVIAYGRLTMQLVAAFIVFSAMAKNQRLLKLSLIWILPLTTYYTYGG